MAELQPAPLPANMFVVLGEAFCGDAGDGGRWVLDKAYKIIAIVDAISSEEACSIFEENCVRTGWYDPTPLKVGPFKASGDASYLREAEMAARATGYGWIVYDKALN